MRARLREARRLIRQYDREATDWEKDRASLLVDPAFLGDDFHRKSPGDVGLLFTALSRIVEVIEEGDAKRLEDPFWLEVEWCAHEVVEEVARSHGFDKGSSLRDSLQRLDTALGKGAATSCRRLLAPSLRANLAYYRALTRTALLARIPALEAMLEDLRSLPGTWRVSATGRVTLLGLLTRRTLVLNFIARADPEEYAVDTRALARKAQIEAFEFLLREIRPDLLALRDEEDLAVNASFLVTSLLIQSTMEQGIPPGAVPVINLCSALVRFDALTSPLRGFHRRERENLLRIAREHPELGLDPAAIVPPPGP